MRCLRCVYDACVRGGTQVNILVGKNGAEKAAKKVTEMLQHHQVGPQLGREGTVSLTARYPTRHRTPP